MIQDTCNICGGSLEDGFCREPIIFGKRPGPTCFACFTAPAQPADWQRGDPKPLHTVDEMMSFGWTDKEAQFHIRAVKRFFRIKTPRASKSEPQTDPAEAQETAPAEVSTLLPVHDSVLLRVPEGPVEDTSQIVAEAM
jgi:hypothetical protein